MQMKTPAASDNSQIMHLLSRKKKVSRKDLSISVFPKPFSGILILHAIKIASGRSKTILIMTSLILL